MGQSLEVMLGQMIMVGFRGAEPEECTGFIERLAPLHLGGVWLTDNDSPMGRTLGNVRSPEQLRRLTDALQAAADAPLLIAIDAEGGQVIRLKSQYGFPEFPSPQSLGDRDDLEHTRREAARIADTLVAAGLNMNLAPVLDLNTNPANPVIGARGRSISADPATVTRHARAIIECHHERGMLCGVKHFPGHGASAADSHLGPADVTDGWTFADVAPYRELAAAGLLDAVLSAHVMVRQIDQEAPATLSPALIDGLLRRDIGFDGPVISDDMNMGAIRRYYGPGEAIERAINAGVDIILHGNVEHYDEHIAEHTLATMERLIATGRILPSRIEQAYARIQRLKGQLEAALPS